MQTSQVRRRRKKRAKRELKNIKVFFFFSILVLRTIEIEGHYWEFFDDESIDSSFFFTLERS
jgi:hypothetical protein